MFGRILHLLSATAFLLALTSLTSAQPPSPVECPAIDVTGPAGEIYPDDNAWFSLSPNLLDIKGLKFEWTVSSGSIVSGQGTLNIEVESSQGPNIPIIATVEVLGLPQGCKNLASETAGIRSPGGYLQIEEYANLPIAEERERLNAVVVDWAKNPGWYLYFILYSDAKADATAYEARAGLIKTYLTVNKTVPAERLVFINGGKSGHRTNVYGVAPDPRKSSRQDSCPILTVSGPAGIIAAGDLATYTANIDLKGVSGTPTYRWTMSIGEIVSGQGTNKIKVRRASGCITATVEVNGFPDSCPLTASESSCHESPPSAVKIGEMRNIEDSVTVIKQFAAELENNPNNQGYILVGHPAGTTLPQIRAREKSIRDAVRKADTGNFDDSRITITTVENSADVVEFWRVPPGASNPTCASCRPKKPLACPLISIAGPPGLPTPGEPILYEAFLKGEVPNGVEYRWFLTTGKIIKGQGTDSITVGSDWADGRQALQVTVEILGLPSGCPNNVTEALAI